MRPQTLLDVEVAIGELYRGTGIPPTVREVADRAHYDASTVSDAVAVLRARGRLVDGDSHRHRSLIRTVDHQAILLALAGVPLPEAAPVAAGGGQSLPHG